MNFIYIFIGGGLGSVLRYFFSVHLASGFWPWATLLVNLLASALLGWLSTRSLSAAQAAFLMTGFCGGLSTFSTLIKEGQSLPHWPSLAYLLASLVLGSLCFAWARQL